MIHDKSDAKPTQISVHDHGNCELCDQIERELSATKAELAGVVEQCAQLIEDDIKCGGEPNRYELAVRIRALHPVLARPVTQERISVPDATGWQPIAGAPQWVYGRDALVGQWSVGHWKKVALWEPQWTRDNIIERGCTHWWPHLPLLPPPTVDQPAAAQDLPGNKPAHGAQEAQTGADPTPAATLLTSIIKKYDAIIDEIDPTILHNDPEADFVMGVVDYWALKFAALKWFEPAATQEPSARTTMDQSETGNLTPASAAAHKQTDHCGFDRNSSLAEARYVCACGWRESSAGESSPCGIAGNL